MFACFGVLTSLKRYRPEWFGRDATAGRAVASVAVPRAIAYPAIAGLARGRDLFKHSPACRLLFAWPVAQLIVGPDAPTMAVLAAAPANISINLSADRSPRLRRAVLRRSDALGR